MPKIKVARFTANFNATDTSGNSHVRFAAGSDYLLDKDDDGELKRCLARGIATEEEVDVPADEPAATDVAVAVDKPAEDKPAKAKK